MHKIRPAAVAGMFYENNASLLRRDLDRLLESVGNTLIPNPVQLKALIVPHAGYVYSGMTAAAAYALLKPKAETISRVVLLGPVHRVPIRGLALSGHDIFRTPLGDIKIDAQACARVTGLPQVSVNQQAHAAEHSLEVQLPFLQRVLPAFSLVAFAVGNATSEEVAEVIEALWGDEETLFIISSDLSHFHSYDEALEIDRQTVADILTLKPKLTHEQACGGTPLNGMLLAAQRHGLTAQLLDCRNSGDTAGDKNRVVGYASFALTSTNLAREQQ